MKKLSNKEAKFISALGVNAMALITGTPLALVVSIPVSIAILSKKETAHDKLVTEISKSFKMDCSDAEIYAKQLEKICNKEYQRQLELEKELMITK